MAERFFAVARTEDLIVQEMGPETLVFDRRTDVAHNLSPIASVVWNLCDGKHDVDALVAAVAEIESADAQAATDAALAELGDLGLLVDGVSRRETMKKMAKFGAGAFSGPLVVSVMAPAAAMATSPGQNQPGTSCTADNQCSGVLVCRTPSNAQGTAGSPGHCVLTTCTTSTAKGSASVCGPTDGTGVNNQSYLTSLCCSGTCKRDNSSAGSQPGTCQPTGV